MILPPRTAPAAAALDRRHTPKPGAYRRYRSCLRWEFGFSCAFCLTHESDLLAHGAEGWGLTGVEHLHAQSNNPTGEQVDDYRNCYYACRLCNGSKGDQPIVDALGRRLLDPCDDAWGV